MEHEEWRPIAWHDGYEVSSLGRVRSFLVDGPNPNRRHDDWRLLKPDPKIVAGRVISLRVTLSVGHGTRNVKRKLVHHLVLEAFTGPCPAGMQCRHKDGDATNNRAGNLMWGTAVENEADKLRHGSHARGERHGCAKLTSEMVRTMRWARAAGVGCDALARVFGVKAPQVSAICTRRAWAHVV